MAKIVGVLSVERFTNISTLYGESINFSTPVSNIRPEYYYYKPLIITKE